MIEKTVVYLFFLANVKPFAGPRGSWLLDSSAQRALRPVMFIAQCAAIFPIDGKLRSDFTLLRFSMKSMNSFLSILTIVGACLLSTLPFIEIWMKGKLTISLARQTAFSIISTMYMVCFFRLAKRWKWIMTSWCHLELRMFKFVQVKVAFQVALFTALYVSSTAFEHVLSYRYEPFCSFSWSEYFLRSRVPLFYLTEFAMWKGVLAALINFMMTMSWNFTDLFLSTVSIVLSSKFEQFHREIGRSMKSKSQSVAYWKAMRETYNHLALFTKSLDKTLSVFLVLSFMNNLFFICFQLLNSLMHMSMTKKIYFVVSFGHILFRTCSVCLTAARIYESSKKPSQFIFSIKSEDYNVEAHRLLLQVLYDRLALTGYNFFYVTKGLLLTVAGTILTYEIFLIQLDHLRPTDPEYNQEYVNCTSW